MYLFFAIMYITHICYSKGDVTELGDTWWPGPSLDREAVNMKTHRPEQNLMTLHRLPAGTSASNSRPPSAVSAVSSHLSVQSLPEHPLRTNYLPPQRTAFLGQHHQIHLRRGVDSIERDEQRGKASYPRSIGLHDGRKPYLNDVTTRTIMAILQS